MSEEVDRRLVSSSSTILLSPTHSSRARAPLPPSLALFSLLTTCRPLAAFDRMSEEVDRRLVSFKPNQQKDTTALEQVADLARTVNRSVDKR
jgi:hypothetical protein